MRSKGKQFVKNTGNTFGSIMKRTRNVLLQKPTCDTVRTKDLRETQKQQKRTEESF